MTFNISARAIALAIVLLFMAAAACGAEKGAFSKLEGFDTYVEKVRSDWNTPAIGVGIVKDGKLIYAKGYGYRDYENKSPMTPTTLFPIASNTKLFTAVAAGMLVEEGKLDWDTPIHESIPTIRFYNDQLTTSVTLRDMLSHRTGITRHDAIWYKSDFSRKELFEKLKYLEPQEPMRHRFLYNNLMFCAVGQAIEMKSGKRWEQFVRERIFEPLGMKASGYNVPEMLKHPDHAMAFTEKRDSSEIYQIPIYQDTEGMAPCGAIISNIEEMSHWLIALMSQGKYEGRQVLPAAALKASLAPAIALPNTLGESLGYWEVMNTAYGMGREMTSYRGHLLTFHGGDLPGFHSQVSFMPQDNIGVIVFVIGDHASPLYNVISYNVYERLLGMDQTPWSDRRLAMRLKDKKAGTEARAKASEGQVKETKPSHAMTEYVGEYEHPAYGVVKITLEGSQLHFDFHKMRFAMTHYHYDRFDTPDDEQDGKWSVNFRTNPQGDVDEAVMSLDEAAAVFTRKAERIDSKVQTELAGNYEMPDGIKVTVGYTPSRGLSLEFPGSHAYQLIPVKGMKFRVTQFADLVMEFVVENGKATALKYKDPAGEFTLVKK